ncbi:hypothetical protein [Rubellicoccus peritrichatus]|uniref:Uncharacterized protein n=1 Tax=Rubellicoccus peritrichatus TaxID=3080537 RepID=A0AAQ3L9Y2_9BACT|nr:hypothetical protein [Puniceicoccus sp. CR14]WOO40659.1 hypothetical protein RZN69_18720 [Puniceicoccus sp. CR14]
MKPACISETVLDRGVARTFSVAWCWFVIAAIFAVALRWLPMHAIEGWNIGYIRHAHSHIAFLGWVFNAFFAFALKLFIPFERRRSFMWLFVFLQVTLVGMVVTFPFQGYAAGSIFFSTLHMIGSAIFAWWLWASPSVDKAARPWLRMALFFMLISGVGPILLGPLAVNDLRNHPAYTLAIYFYLHCQYNGWFILFLIAVVVHILAKKNFNLDTHTNQRAAGCFLWGVLLAYALSCLWVTSHWLVHSLALVSAGLQLYATWLLWPLLKHGLTQLTPTIRAIVLLPLVCFGLKLLLQSIAPLPVFSELAYHRFIAVAFMHLIFLGVVTPALWVGALQWQWLSFDLATKAGAALFLLGTLATQISLVALPLFHLGGTFLVKGLFIYSLIILVGLLLNACRLQV